MSSAFPRLELAKRLKTRAFPACRSPNRSGLSGFASYPIEGMCVLVPSEVHPYGGTWALYMIAPVILCGVVASLWLIVKGAIGVFGWTPRGERVSTIPSTTGSSSRTAAAKRGHQKVMRNRLSTSNGRSASPCHFIPDGDRQSANLDHFEHG